MDQPGRLEKYFVALLILGLMVGFSGFWLFQSSTTLLEVEEPTSIYSDENATFNFPGKESPEIFYVSISLSDGFREELNISINNRSIEPGYIDTSLIRDGNEIVIEPDGLFGSLTVSRLEVRAVDHRDIDLFLVSLAVSLFLIGFSLWNLRSRVRQISKIICRRKFSSLFLLILLIFSIIWGSMTGILLVLIYLSLLAAHRLYKRRVSRMDILKNAVLSVLPLIISVLSLLILAVFDIGNLLVKLMIASVALSNLIAPLSVLFRYWKGEFSAQKTIDIIAFILPVQLIFALISTAVLLGGFLALMIQAF